MNAHFYMFECCTRCIATITIIYAYPTTECMKFFICSYGVNEWYLYERSLGVFNILEIWDDARLKAPVRKAGPLVRRIFSLFKEKNQYLKKKLSSWLRKHNKRSGVNALLLQFSYVIFMCFGDCYVRWHTKNSWWSQYEKIQKLFLSWLLCTFAFNADMSWK